MITLSAGNTALTLLGESFTNTSLSWTPSTVTGTLSFYVGVGGNAPVPVANGQVTLGELDGDGNIRQTLMIDNAGLIYVEATGLSGSLDLDYIFEDSPQADTTPSTGSGTLFTEADIGDDGCIICASLKRVLAALNTAVAGGLKRVQWDGRTKEFQSLSELQSALNHYKSDYAVRCGTGATSTSGASGSGWTFHQGKYCGGSRSGHEGDESYHGDIE